MNHRMVEILLILLAILLIKTACAGEKKTGFLKRSVTVDGKSYCYQVFIPESYSPEKKWPVILFLHGAGERGSDCQSQVEVGIRKLIHRQKKKFPCIVVLPQCQRRRVWSGEMETQALKALEQTVAEFNGDSKRLYLTGLSMGGYGTWYLAARHPNKFAAIAPVCGGVVPPPMFPFPPDAAKEIPKEKPYETVASKINQTPVWVFHGSADPVIPVTESHKMVAALKTAGAKPKYSEYKGVGHNSWDRAYAEPDFLEWLLSHRLESE